MKWLGPYYYGIGPWFIGSLPDASLIFKSYKERDIVIKSDTRITDHIWLSDELSMSISDQLLMITGLDWYNTSTMHT